MAFQPALGNRANEAAAGGEVKMLRSRVLLKFISQVRAYEGIAYAVPARGLYKSQGLRR